MTKKRHQLPNDSESLPETRGGLDATAVANMLDQADTGDFEQLGEEVAEVRENLDAVVLDVEELKGVVSASEADLHPLDHAPGAESDDGSSKPSESVTPAPSTGTVTPVLVNGQPATPEEHRMAMETLRTGDGCRMRYGG